MLFPLHKNGTGSFQELAHARDVKFGQLSSLTINPGNVRGGHYHTVKEEWFCCIRGKCCMDMFDAKNPEDHRQVFLDGSNREFVKVSSFEVHTITNFSLTEECEVLIIANEEFDPQYPDTFRYSLGVVEC